MNISVFKLSMLILINLLFVKQLRYLKAHFSTAFPGGSAAKKKPADGKKP
jgi:hypothetical protein